MVFPVNTQLIFHATERGRPEFKFNTVNSFTVESSWRSLTSKASVVLAKQLLFDDRKKVYDLIKSGDKVTLRGGYNGNYMDEFTGFVSNIQDSMPLVIEMEDNMYQLKRTPVHRSYESVRLAGLLKDIVPGKYKIDAMSVDLGTLVLSRTTVSQVLQHLKDHYGIYSYFVGDTLISGKIYVDNIIYDDNGEMVTYSINGFNKNVVSNTLKYRRKEDINLKVRMTSYLSDGTNKSISVGDEGGQEVKLVCSNVEDPDALKALATKEYNRLKVDGLSGSITGFAYPFVKHGYKVKVINNEAPAQEGTYFVDAVKTHFNDMGAYRREVMLGPRAA